MYNLHGFGFGGYKSFVKTEKLYPLKRINFIIGKNNSGKSNIIEFLHKHYNHCIDALNKSNYSTNANSRFELSSLEKPININCDFSFSYCISLKSYEDFILQKYENIAKTGTDKIFKKLYQQIFEIIDQQIWITYSATHLNNEIKPCNIKTYSSDMCHSQDIHNLWGSITGQRGGALREHWLPETVAALIPPPPSKKNIIYIPAIRQIGPEGTEFNDYSGNGIINRLSKFQNPRIENMSDRDIFNKINKFTQEVLENSSAKIEIPHDNSMILVSMDNKTLPLSSLGTGVHEVIILAIAATVESNSIVCIEEPELHLHPHLQKKLISYLSTDTKNQYIFTTHSAHLLDSTDAQIFHIRNDGEKSTLESIASTRNRSEICAELGYKASDILQTNCIIWVEGPSDRTYIKHWISIHNRNLVEGTQYSIMFYGGKLASHLSGEDNDESDKLVQDLISLRPMNRNSVIVIDSDKSSAHKPLNKTKKRLKAEFEKGPGLIWITDGREIENYLNYEKLILTIKKKHPSAKEFAKSSKWENLLNYKNNKGITRIASKQEVALQYIIDHPNEPFTPELKKQIVTLCQFIENCNK
ncbi:putative ATP-dependent endonuclease of OLD family [Chromobacterium alkanivorans]|uniref:ATP-binding protein n=1 Tax=Chromobacterium alkanivorans TaxID=1071719 RepID=UPI002168EEC6|nr:ATP-binding protein [Chromobacterium alkanivorans]MCS3804690.1 putative ATP-dependent endonuclease of OLD family [Chromobacterium alkanivorans]MCS3819030.1 putative ATP-dependent endonuclease of OLD family [Chromobacterium alkanivorans]MCS3873113.1 putative ATP-dependent endonuclease of OLD family [Chromobacterium alkanivorans]